MTVPLAPPAQFVRLPFDLTTAEVPATSRPASL